MRFNLYEDDIFHDCFSPPKQDLFSPPRSPLVLFAPQTSIPGLESKIMQQPVHIKSVLPPLLPPSQTNWLLPFKDPLKQPLPFLPPH